MTQFGDGFDGKMNDILSTPWNSENARVVPKTENVAQRDGAKLLEATYLYADMADSTLLVKRYKKQFAARVIRMYMRASVDCIRNKGGHIRSFDGDRVMGVFIGERRRNDAVEAALNLSWVVDQVINPKLAKHLERTNSALWSVSHRSGIDDGETFIVRGGARDNSDLVSIGNAPNIAAKLSGIRGESGSITITSHVYNFLNEKNKMSGDLAMWKKRAETAVGPHNITTYSCGWMRKP